MVTIRSLKQVSYYLFIGLLLNISFKILYHYIIPWSLLWMVNCQGNECNELSWWQHFPLLEKFIWRLVDNLNL
ncbi:hypothetical protein Kpol_246p6 [Vanderwaltozyma polyspora DSM 70294]|uniref:Uncharacterized protein n=1 Tax=Vanderwaltozyma polyspora (strain ATCC 22028 / DSM 70294 / BCRC 21397 / CBS 2163 / NBRC 10782 / NRRL Y-8283 / UCD 57-17) TaxID=436907 RepID=A7TT75_VANPO|nr:uncharacterized protein Kpol_246p6 [Vanderwaltozyma polyspora DSM 70294]EDO14537.1 hypothetical protein Kpol_246p6 [Vanderwaltozyma polyspora DSM 70294]